MDNAIEFNGIWKRYRKGEKFYALRDLIPFLVQDVFSAKNKSKNTSFTDGLKENEFWVLKDINFTIKPGEIIGIIGHNGAGKSTILKLLSKIIKPTKGDVKINGRLSALIEVTAGFHPDFTGRENIYFNGAVYGMKKVEIDKKFDEIVEFSGVEEFIDTPVKRYSSGMSARLGFSIAAHVNPDILLVDEVLSVGDMNFQAKCVDKIRDLLREGKTIVFVSHNIPLVQSLCQRVIMIEKGQIIKEGTPYDVIPFYEASVHDKKEKELKKRLEKYKNKPESGQEMNCDISNVRICDPLGQEKMEHSFNQPLRLQIDYEIKRGAQDIVVQYEIFRVEGTCCCSGNSRDDGFLLQKKVGKNSIKVDIGLFPFHPGAYYLKVSIWDNDVVKLFVSQRKQFSISPYGIIFKTKAALIPKAIWSESRT